MNQNHCDIAGWQLGKVAFVVVSNPIVAQRETFTSFGMRGWRISGVGCTAKWDKSLQISSRLKGGKGSMVSGGFISMGALGASASIIFTQVSASTHNFGNLFI